MICNDKTFEGENPWEICYAICINIICSDMLCLRSSCKDTGKSIFDINKLSNARDAYYDADDDGAGGAEENDGKDEVARRSLGRS